MLSCLDCKHCVIYMRYRKLRCRKGKWITLFNRERKVSLLKSEVAGPEHIRHRQLFEMAGECKKVGDYESMEDNG